jgi:hypothetical protein
MKVFSMVFVLSFVLVSSVFAFTISPKFGVVSSNMTEATLSVQGTGLEIGCDLNFPIEDNLTLITDLNIIGTNYSYVKNYAFTTYNVGVRGVYKFLSSSKVIPFVGAGIVATSTTAIINDVNQLSNALGYQLLTGVEYKEYFAQIKYYVQAFTATSTSDDLVSVPISNVAVEFGFKL